MTTLLQDIRYGARTLLKSPGFTVVAVLALALGVGANTAIFSVVNAVLLRALPFEKPEELVRVWATNARRGVTSNPTSYLNFVDWRSQNNAFEFLAAYSQASAALTGGDAPEQINGVVTTADLLPALGVRAALGRYFTEEEAGPGEARVVVIGHGLWQRRFGGDPNLIGREIMLNGRSRTVVGVMPAGFKFPLNAEATEFWMPLDPTSELNRVRGANYLGVVARLKPTATLAQAQSEMDAIARRLEEQYPEQNSGRGIRLVSMYEDTVGNVRPALLVLLGAVGCVLLIACANVANLLLARAAARGKEIALRTALGANRWRIVRQLLTESLLLALAGGALGSLLALWGVDLLVSMIPPDVPRVGEIGLDVRVLGFTTAISVTTGIVFGLAPALAASKLDLNESLKEGGRGSSESFRRNRLRSALVVSEIALSLVLLIGAGLLIKSFLRLREIDPGFNPEKVMAMDLALPSAKYVEESAQSRFFQELLARVGALPGVEAVGVVDPLPLGGNMAQNGFTIEGRPPLAPGERLVANARIISADYFRAMNIPLLEGRALTERDAQNAPKTIVVNQTLARRFFGNENPIGKRATVTIAPDFTAEIVGIVGDVRHRSLEAESGPEFYVSYLQVSSGGMSLVARTATGDVSGLLAAVRREVQQLDKDQPISDTRPMTALLAQSIAPRRFNMLLLGTFAFVALALAGVGIFGVMSYTVTRRTHELGIRMALGAQRGDVLRLVLRQGMTLTALGVCLGLVGAYTATRLLSSLLYGVSSSDPVTFILVTLLLAAVAFLACYVPARRATKVDPMVALRYE